MASEFVLHGASFRDACAVDSCDGYDLLQSIPTAEKGTKVDVKPIARFVASSVLAELLVRDGLLCDTATSVVDVLH